MEEVSLLGIGEYQERQADAGQSENPVWPDIISRDIKRHVWELKMKTEEEIRRQIKWLEEAIAEFEIKITEDFTQHNITLLSLQDIQRAKIKVLRWTLNEL